MVNECANKALVLTAPARGNFGIIARHKCFGGGGGAFPPHGARARRQTLGVSDLATRQPPHRSRGKCVIFRGARLSYPLFRLHHCLVWAFERFLINVS